MELKNIEKQLIKAFKDARICCVHNSGDDPEPCGYTIRECVKIIKKEFKKTKNQRYMKELINKDGEKYYELKCMRCDKKIKTPSTARKYCFECRQELKKERYRTK